MQEDPDILKWKNGGPKFLELMDKCFKGTVATGFAVLMPYQDPPLHEEGNIHLEDIEDNENNPVNEDEGDNYEVHHGVQPTTLPSSSNMSTKKRKKGKGDKKIGVAEKLQQSLDRLIDGVDQSSNTTVMGALPDDPYGYDKCLLMLNDVPGLEKGSSQYFLAMRILVKKENRMAFCHLMNNDREMTIGWLNTFTEDDIPRSRR